MFVAVLAISGCNGLALRPPTAVLQPVFQPLPPRERHHPVRAVSASVDVGTTSKNIRDSLLESFRVDELRISGRTAEGRYSSKYWFVSLISTHKSLVLRRIMPHILFNCLLTCAVLATRLAPSNPLDRSFISNAPHRLTA